MKERIIKIMETENLTPSLFADKLNIGRAVVSHILSGRNNPSLDVVIRILDTIDYIDADWLLSGKGNMRKSDNLHQDAATPSQKDINSSVSADDLFDNKTQQTASIIPIVDNNTAIGNSDDTHPSSTYKESDANKSNPISAMLNTNNKKISKIIIYYSDNTFQAFNPDNAPF